MKVEQKVGITKPPAVNNLYVFSWNLNKNKFRNLNTKQTTTVTASRAWRKKKTFNWPDNSSARAF